MSCVSASEQQQLKSNDIKKEERCHFFHRLHQSWIVKLRFLLNIELVTVSLLNESLIQFHHFPIENSIMSNSSQKVCKKQFPLLEINLSIIFFQLID